MKHAIKQLNHKILCVTQEYKKFLIFLTSEVGLCFRKKNLAFTFRFSNLSVISTYSFVHCFCIDNLWMINRRYKLCELLGINIDNKLTFDDHIFELCNKASI